MGWYTNKSFRRPGYSLASQNLCLRWLRGAYLSWSLGQLLSALRVNCFCYWSVYMANVCDWCFACCIFLLWFGPGGYHTNAPSFLAFTGTVETVSLRWTSEFGCLPIHLLFIILLFQVSFLLLVSAPFQSSLEKWNKIPFYPCIFKLLRSFLCACSHITSQSTECFSV